MAYYAQLGEDNIVTRVVKVNNRDCMTEGGIEKEDLGAQYLIGITGHLVWINVLIILNMVFIS